MPASSISDSVFSNAASLSVGKPAIRSAPKAMSGRDRADRRDQGEGVGPRVPALHPLEDEIVSGLKGKVEVRHEPRLLG